MTALSRWRVPGRSRARKRKRTPTRARGGRSRARRRRPAHGSFGRARRTTARAALAISKLVLLAVLPFALLVRGAVTAHVWLGVPGWSSVVAGTAVGAIALAWVGRRVGRRLGRDARSARVALAYATPIALLFALSTAGWLARTGAKNPEIAARWSELHPALRIAVGTARWADESVVVTEIGRSRGDYDRMGLPRRKRSMHYVQGDGWVHAVDLRTIGHGELRNRAAQLYFDLMGFETLRHSGTADHLHVELPQGRRPPAVGAGPAL